MSKLGRLFIFLLLAKFCFGQGGIGTPGFRDPRWQTVGVGALAARPVTCTANRSVFVCNGAGCTSNGSYYYCTAPNVWTLGGGGGSGGTGFYAAPVINGVTTVTAAVHGEGTQAVVVGCINGATPAAQIPLDGTTNKWTRNTLGDIVITSNASGTCYIGSTGAPPLTYYASDFTCATTPCTLTVTHGLGSTDAQIFIMDSSGNLQTVEAGSIQRTSSNVISVQFAAAQSGRVVVIAPGTVGGGGGSGTVNSGTTGQLAYYAADGTTISGSSCTYTFTTSYVLTCGAGTGDSAEFDFYDGGSGFYSRLSATTLTANRAPTLPNVSGSIMVSSGSFSNDDCAKYSNGNWITTVCGGGGSGGLSPSGTYYGTADSGVSYYGPMVQMYPPSAITFTGLNMSTSPAASFTAIGNAYELTSAANSGDNVRYEYITAPATPWSITIFISPKVPLFNYQLVGLAAQDSGGGKFVGCHYGFHTSFLNSTLGGFSAFTTVSTAGSSSSVGTSSTMVNTGLPLGIKLVDNGTNMTCSVSYNLGGSWEQTYSASETAYLATKANRVGLFSESSNATYGNSMTVLSWKQGTN